MLVYRRIATLLLALVAIGVSAAGTHAVGQQPTHWSYRPLTRPAVPEQAVPPQAVPGQAVPGQAVPGQAVARDGATDLDAFVLRRMREHGLEGAAPADRATWLRRVTLDLTGLPPTLAELEAFLADDPSGARERVVDRLLDSDAYAERWAAWWLDLARYADSQGYEKDGLRRGMWRYRDWVLQAFRSHMPLDQFTVEQLAGDLLPNANDDQRLATAFHRQTMSNTEGGTDNEEFRVAAIVDRVDTTMQVWMGSTLGCAQCHDHKYDAFSQREFFELFAYFDQTEDADRDDDAPIMFAPTVEERARQQVITLELAEVRKQLAEVPKVTVEQSAWQMLGPIAGETFADVRDGAFAAERDGVWLEQEQDGLRWQAKKGFADGKVHTLRGKNSAFYLFRTVTSESSARAVLSLGADDALRVWWNGHEVLREDRAGAAKPDEHRVEVAMRAGTNSVVLKIANGGGPGGFCYELWAAGEGDLRAQVRDLERDLDAVRGARVPVLRELASDKRRTTRVHIRGSFLDQGDEVSPGTPRVWPQPAGDAPKNRLGFAKWLVSDDNPLTARVLANRIWSEMFGRGLVWTLEDFGTQGAAPSHPELLDWLACELRESGWSLPHLLKTIALSSTYGQSSSWTDAHRDVDPENVWLSRGPSFRLSAEQLRDQALAVAGLLHQQVGGPSVMPPQPDGVWRQIYSGAKWRDATDEDRYRRALYTFWRRTSPHPAMLMFDAQSREACVLRRQRTNTPLQALVLWNDPQFVEPAKALADAVLAAESDDDARLGLLWRRCLLRDPSEREADRLLALLAEERERGAVPRDAWAVVASVVLCLDEFVARR
ncbi:MAG: DUF1549 and DUF1553 domain-containing protein [Planctomycetota bacterium]